jgi:hypothetical protein
MSFADNNNGTVTDNITGLMWQKQDDGTTRTWSTAGTYCSSLSVGGHSDWRLPEVLELMSIVNYGIVSPAINTIFFPNTQTSYYWSSTTYADNPAAVAWMIGFNDGGFNTSNMSDYQYVRCVRGGQEAESFTDNGNATVTDSGTGLMWQQAEGGSMTWNNALSYCEGLSLGAQSDWRLPNVKELTSITDFTKFNPAINTTFFPDAYASYYWSSTTYRNYASQAWNVSFYRTIENSSSKSNVVSNYVRCVRGGQSGVFGNLILSVTKAGTGSGTVTANYGTISWSGSTGTGSYSSGTSITLTAAANSGSTFTGWSGACSSQSASAACLVTMSAAEAVTANYVLTGTTPFSDVPSSEPFASYIEAIYNNGITVGCGNGNYCSANNVTRDQMAAFLVRSTQVEAGQSTVNFTCNEGANCATETPYFNDVPTTDGFFPYVQKLYELGITTGCGSGDYCPSENVTRDQMAAFIIRALYGQNYTCNGGVPGASVACASTTPYFNDVPTTDGFFPYVQKMYELGITKGCGNGNYCPSEDVTRDQMAAFLARAFLGMQ